MRLSRLLAPTSRTNPGKVRDGAVIALVRGGYALYEAASQQVLLLPLGQVSLDNVLDLFEDLCLAENGQAIDAGPVPGGALAAAVRVVRQEEQLPMTLFERRGRGFDLFWIDAEEGDVQDKPLSLFESLGSELESRGMEPVLLEENLPSGRLVRLALKGDDRAKDAVEGLRCPRCGWGGTAHSPAPGRSGGCVSASEALREAHTPGADTIAELCRQLNLPPERTLKTMFYSVPRGGTREVIAVLMRGDCKISDVKLAAFFGANEVRFATPVELHETMGTLGGYLGPVGLPEGVTLVADENVEGIAAVAVGANRPDCHLTGAAWGRDFTATAVTDLLALEPGQACPDCGSPLETARWRVIAEAEPLERLPEGMEMTYRDGERRSRKPSLVRGRLDGEALLLGLFDREGAPLPLDLAPFQVLVTPWGDPESLSAQAAERLHETLSEAGFAVLLDDRYAKAAAREADFESLAIPLRVAVDDAQGAARATLRLEEGERLDLPLEDAAHALLHALGGPCGCDGH